MFVVETQHGIERFRLYKNKMGVKAEATFHIYFMSSCICRGKCPSLEAVG